MPPSTSSDFFTRYVVLHVSMMYFINSIVLFIQWKEVFAFFFAIFVNIGHIILMVILFQNNGTPGTFVFTFSFCYFLGEGCRFFYYVMKPPRLDWSAMVLLEDAWRRYVLSSIVCFLMLLMWIFQLVIWTTTYIEG